MIGETKNRIDSLVNKLLSGPLSDELALEMTLIMQELANDMRFENEHLQEINEKNKQIIRLQEIVQEQDIKLGELDGMDMDCKYMREFIQHKKLGAAYSKYLQTRLAEPDKPTLTRIK